MRIERALVAAAALVAATPDLVDAACIPGFDYAAFGKNSVTFGGGAKTNSYNSATGTYASTNSLSNGNIGTNGDSCGAITLNGAPTTINGNAQYGDTGSACSVSGAGSVTGTKTSLGTDVSLPSVTIPTIGSAMGNQSVGSHGTLNLTPNNTYGSISVTGGSNINFSAGTYVISSISLAGNSTLTVTSGPVIVYVSCTSPSATTGIDLTGGTLSNSTLISTNMVFMVGSACGNVKVTGGTNAAYAVYAPDSDATMSGGADVYGAVVGKTITNTGGSYIHRDLALANLAIGDFQCAQTEVSRASPIVTTLSSQEVVVQGTFAAGVGTRRTIVTTGDVASFTFPYGSGHLRARTTASVSTTASSYSSGTVLFDAGATGKIPTANNAGCSTWNGSCRQLFTVTQTPTSGVSSRPPRVSFNDTNASTIGALIAPTSVVSGITSTHWQTIVRTVLAGKLGGIDRSTAAVIGPSPVAGVSTRPTIAYVGSTDGMLHAVCASTGGTTPTQTNVCPSLGTELWAFMPRVQLPLVRGNMTRIDGSVRVVDAFGDFTAAQSGTRSFRTVLTLQTGYANSSYSGAVNAVYAIDITDPADPTVLWEYTAPTSTTYELGTGLSLATGPTLVNGKISNLVVAATNNGGSGGSGLVVTALSLETGAKQWQFGYAYPSPARAVAADGSVPSTGIPGGAVGVDLAGNGYTTDIVTGDLYGQLWRLDATNGTSKTGTGVPLFRHSTNKKPIGAVPAIYSDGTRQIAGFGTGGYADPISASWASGTQQLIGIPLTAAGPYPLSEASTTIAFKQDLASGYRSFAQVLVVGGELFATADNTDVNAASFGLAGTNTGNAIKVNVATSASTTYVVRGGASSLAHGSTTLYASSSDRQEKLSSTATSATGTSVDTLVASKIVRLLWIRQE